MMLLQQFGVLLLLALPVACVSWTVTHEEILREFRDFCKNRSETCRVLLLRKMFYLFTCEYCFSHYVAAIGLWMTHFRLLMPDWRGYVLAEFGLVFVANVFMSGYNRLRLNIKHENVEIAVKQKEVDLV